MDQAIVVRSVGGPEVLKSEPITVGEPEAGQVKLRQTIIGANFHDCYMRSGLYPTLTLPGIPGLEAIGIVEAVGTGVVGFRPGDRVVYVTGQYGSYATARLIDANLLIRLPQWLDDRTAGAIFLRGLTAQYLVLEAFPIRAGHIVLVHAAAGGVGNGVEIAARR